VIGAGPIRDRSGLSGDGLRVGVPGAIGGAGRGGNDDEQASCDEKKAQEHNVAGALLCSQARGV